MTIDEAIQHCYEIGNPNCDECGHTTCNECEKEHIQLAKWLEELKAKRKSSTKIEENYDVWSKETCDIEDILDERISEYFCYIKEKYGDKVFEDIHWMSVKVDHYGFSWIEAYKQQLFDVLDFMKKDYFREDIPDCYGLRFSDIKQIVVERGRYYAVKDRKEN